MSDQSTRELEEKKERRRAYMRARPLTDKDKERKKRNSKARAERKKLMRATNPNFRQQINDEQNAYLKRKKEKLAGRARPSCCDVCNTYDRLIVWDHNHTTNMFRGWLCHSCNLILGHANDDPNLLEKLAVYLRVAGSDQ